MKQYELIAFDMDGTLLDSQQEISQPTIQAIKDAAKKGKKVVLSTGRALTETIRYAEFLPEIRYGILGSATLLYDYKEKKILDRKIIEKEVVKGIVEVAKKYDIMPFAISMGKGNIQKDQLEVISKYHMGPFKQFYEVTAKHYDNIVEELLSDDSQQFEKINLYATTPEERKLVKSELEKFQIEMVEAEETGLEITPYMANKGQGLKNLSAILNIPLEQTIAVGDSDNDETIIKAAGLGIAMGNANERIKSIAGAVVADNNSNGCKEAIEKYLLQ